MRLILGVIFLLILAGCASDVEARCLFSLGFECSEARFQGAQLEFFLVNNLGEDISFETLEQTAEHEGATVECSVSRQTVPDNGQFAVACNFDQPLEGDFARFDVMLEYVPVGERLPLVASGNIVAPIE